MTFPYAGLPAARIGSRVGAYVLDMLWLNGSSYAILLAAYLISMPGIVVMVPVLAVVAVYYVTMGKGQSPGMKTVGIRLVRLDDGLAPGFWTALGRGLVFALGGSIILGYLSPLFDATGANRGWHDKASNTWMVDVKSSLAAGVATPLSMNPAVMPLSPPPPPPARAAESQAAMADSVAPTGLADDFASDSSPVLETVLAPPRGATPPIASGLISAVPGFEPRVPAVAASAVPAAAPVPSSIPAGPVSPAGLAFESGQDDDLDRTRAAAPKTVAVRWVFRLDTGDEFTVDGPGFIGRNPVTSEAGHSQLIPFADDTKSISKTHLGFGIDGSRLWVTDRRSTNGTSLIRSGHSDRAVSTEGPTYVEAGDVLALGDRRISVATR